MVHVRSVASNSALKICVGSDSAVQISRGHARILNWLSAEKLDYAVIAPC